MSRASCNGAVITNVDSFLTPSAPIYSGQILFSVEKAYPVFWPGNTIGGRFEPEMDIKISLVLIAFYHSSKTHITQGPITVAEAKVEPGKHIFQLVIPDQINGQSLPMSFRDDHAHIEYRLVGFDVATNEQLRGHLAIQIMTPVLINEDDYRVMKLEKRLKTFGIFQRGDIKIGIRVNNPELRPGEDLSIKLVFHSGAKKRRIKKVSLTLFQRVVYNLAKESNALFAPQKDHQLHKVKQTFSSLYAENGEDLKMPLSISLPPLVPSTKKWATFGNYTRVSYYVKVKLTTGSYNSAWEIPIHVGTTSQRQTKASPIDMDYALLRKDDEDENSNIYGVIFTQVGTPWPTENDTEKITLDLSKVTSAPNTERSAISLGGGTHSSIVAPCDYSETQLTNLYTGDASTMTSRSNQNSMQSYLSVKARDSSVSSLTQAAKL